MFNRCNLSPSEYLVSCPQTLFYCMLNFTVLVWDNLSEIWSSHTPNSLFKTFSNYILIQIFILPKLSSRKF